MSFLKINLKTKIYLLVSAIALIIWQIGISIRTFLPVKIYDVKRILEIMPNFLLAVAVPFGMIALIQLFKIAKNETRFFYGVIFFTLFAAVLSEWVIAKYFFGPFDIFDIIATCIALYIDMVLQNNIETKFIKAEYTKTE